jgi:hypothetical protein
MSSPINYYNDGTTQIPTYYGTITNVPTLIPDTYSVGASDILATMQSSMGYQSWQTPVSPNTIPSPPTGSVNLPVPTGVYTPITSDQLQTLMDMYIIKSGPSTTFANFLNGWPQFASTIGQVNLQASSTNVLENSLFDEYAKSLGSTIVRDSTGTITDITGDWSILTHNADGSFNPASVATLQAGFLAAGQNYFQSSSFQTTMASLMTGGASTEDEQEVKQTNAILTLFNNPGISATSLAPTSFSIPQSGTDPQVLLNFPNQPHSTMASFVNLLAGTNAFTGAQFSHTISTTLLTGISQAFTSDASLQTTTPDGTGPSFDDSSLASYQTVYNGFKPGGNFKADLQTFVQQQISSVGYFNPSTSFSAWVQQLLPSNVSNAPTLSASNNYAITGSSLDGNDSDSVMVIGRILALLIQMINTLQKVGIAQAGQLKFNTSFQQAYTALQEQIPTYVLNQAGSNGSQLVISANTTDASNSRNDINAVINGNLSDNLRSLNTLQQDGGKQIQSNINQTNDAVNSQTDMCSTFLQQLNSLLTAIMK